MAEAVSTITVIKGGAMVASSSLFTTAVIFTDKSYMYLAIAGAIVSTLGVIHELFKAGASPHTCASVCVEVTKGVVLGLFAIPFWFLAITEGVLQGIIKLELGQVSTSLALIVAFGLSWFTVPIFVWLTNKVKVKAKDA